MPRHFPRNPIVWLLALVMMLGAGPASAQTGGDTPPALTARITGDKEQKLQVLLPAAPPVNGKPGRRLFELTLNKDAVPDSVIRPSPRPPTWFPLDAVQVAGADGRPVQGWFVLGNFPSDRQKFRVVVANFDFRLAQQPNLPVADGAAPVVVNMPLVTRQSPLPIDVRTGEALATVRPAPKVQAALAAAAEAEVAFSANVGTNAAPSLTALGLGERVELSWRVTRCVRATLTGPISYGQTVLVSPPVNGVCEGTMTVLAMGPATYTLSARVQGQENALFNDDVRKDVKLDVLRLDQFATLQLNPVSILPGGEIEVRWFVRELPTDDKREIFVEWTDVNGKRRLQRLRKPTDERLSGSMKFAAANKLGDSRSNLVRLLYGSETIERTFEITRWQQADSSGAKLGEAKGMAYADGHLVLCTATGLYLSRVDQNGGAATGQGKVNDPFPAFTKQALHPIDMVRTTAGPPADPHGIQDAPCLAIHEYDSERVVAVIQKAQPAPNRPAYPELVFIRPANQTSSYPVTLTSAPVKAGAKEHRDYQVARLDGRVYVMVQIGPADRGMRSGQLDAASTISTWSISEDDIRSSKGSWLEEELLSTPALVPSRGWLLADGVGNAAAALVALNNIDGQNLRFTALKDAAGFGWLDFPRVGQSAPPEYLARLSNPTLVNTRGLLVMLGSNLTYNAMSNHWNAGSFGDDIKPGAVAAFRDDDEPRMWLVNPDGSRHSLEVATPRLFSADYHEGSREISIPHLGKKATFVLRSPETMKWSTNIPTRLVAKEPVAEEYDCPEKPGKVAGFLTVIEVGFTNRFFRLTGTSETGSGNVIAIDHSADGEAGRWESPVAQGSCLLLTRTD